VSSVCVWRRAESQWGAISTPQLQECGLARTTISRWAGAGWLHVYDHGVYFLGHRRVTPEARCKGSLLYAGGDAVLSHLAAAWLWGLADDPPARVDVTAARRVRSTRPTRAHRAERIERAVRSRLPVTTVARTLLDCATVLEPKRLARMVREADYQRRLHVEAALALCGRGRAGSAALRAALVGYLPELAHTDSELEARFLELCARGGLEPPEVQVLVAGIRVDAVWRRHRLVVELDGSAAHATVAGLHRDRERDLLLRAAGFRAVRYTWDQVTRRPRQILADLRRLQR
jgi:predicted transcriptional regulator of viral defense system